MCDRFNHYCIRRGSAARINQLVKLRVNERLIKTTIRRAVKRRIPLRKVVCMMILANTRRYIQNSERIGAHLFAHKNARIRVIIGEKRKLELVPLLIFYIERIDKLTGCLISVAVTDVDERILSITCVTLDTDYKWLHLGPTCVTELAHSLIETEF